jgi:thiamine phosphate synthase YjbQ (UPF0047 family)
MDSLDPHIDMAQRRIVDLTDQVRAFCCGKDAGLLSVFVPYSTAGVALIETGFDEDLKALVARLLPRALSYKHRHGAL